MTFRVYPSRPVDIRGRVIARIRERGLAWACAHSLLFCWDKCFDYVLYPLAIIEYGLLWGTAVMMAASLVICVVLLRLYDRLASTRLRDLLGFESIKEAASAVGRSRLNRFNQGRHAWVAKAASRTGLFLYLSVWFDAMTCIIFLRPTDSYEMTPKYWSLFCMSVVVSNGVWGILVFFGVESVTALIGLLA